MRQEEMPNCLLRVAISHNGHGIILCNVIQRKLLRCFNSKMKCDFIYNAYNAYIDIE